MITFSIVLKIGNKLFENIFNSLFNPLCLGFNMKELKNMHLTIMKITCPNDTMYRVVKTIEPILKSIHSMSSIMQLDMAGLNCYPKDNPTYVCLDLFEPDENYIPKILSAIRYKIKVGLSKLDVDMKCYDKQGFGHISLNNKYKLMDSMVNRVQNTPINGSLIFSCHHSNFAIIYHNYDGKKIHFSWHNSKVCTIHQIKDEDGKILTSKNELNEFMTFFTSFGGMAHFTINNYYIKGNTIVLKRIIPADDYYISSKKVYASHGYTFKIGNPPK